jgi:hypothetical protein
MQVMSHTGYTDEQLEFIHKLEELDGYTSQQADDGFRNLIAEVQDEFESLKRGAVREGLETDERLNVADVLDFGAGVSQDFPKAQKGCQVFASVYFAEQAGNAPNN